MKTTYRRIAFFVALALVLALIPATANAQTKTVVKWFVGLGTGTDAAQIAVQEALVKKFNESQNEIDLQITIAASNQAAPDAFAALLGTPDQPDLVGPMGFSGANLFPGNWLDLKPLIDSTKYDLSNLPESLMKLYESPEGLIGIPFATFPSMMFYNKDLFDEAELAYPPSAFDAKYMLNGKEVDWNWDTVAEIAKILTVDTNGEDATSDKFDPNTIAQFGFIHQWGTIRADLSVFGGATFNDADGKVTFPDYWRAAAKWIHERTWKDHTIPTGTYENSDLLKPSAFASGKVAMARVPSWYTCCLGDLKSKWDLAVVPSYNGKYHAPVDADTFRIMKSSKNPEASFKVLTYLLGEGALELLTTYGAFPARPDLQSSFIEGLGKRYPSVEHWDAINASLSYAAVPNHEYYFPGFAKGQLRFADFRTLIGGDAGKDIDVDAELDKLAADLEAIIKEASTK